MADPSPTPDEDVLIRTLAAFFAAPFSAALALGIPAYLFGVHDAVEGTIYLSIILMPFSLFIGMPLWALLRRRIAHSVLMTALTGAVAAWTSMLVLGAFFPLILIAGVFPGVLAMLGYAGAVGGATVWLIAGTRRGGRREKVASNGTDTRH